MLKLFPTEHLRTANGYLQLANASLLLANACLLLQHYHLYRTRNVARFSDAYDAKYGIGAFKDKDVLDSSSSTRSSLR